MYNSFSNISALYVSLDTHLTDRQEVTKPIPAEKSFKEQVAFDDNKIVFLLIYNKIVLLGDLISTLILKEGQFCFLQLYFSSCV